MNVYKIVGLLGILIAIVGAFVTIPYVGLLLLIAGLIVGINIAREDTVRVLVTALVLTVSHGHSFDAVPGDAGKYLSAIVAGIAALVTGAALMIIGRNIYARFKL